METTFNSNELQTLRKDYTYIMTGNSLITAQYVERVCKLLCAFLKPSGINIKLEDLMSEEADKTRATLGQVSKALKSTGIFSEDFAVNLSSFVQRRNRLIHSLFIDTFHTEESMVTESENSVNYFDFCNNFMNDGVKLIETVFGIQHEIGLLFIRRGMNSPELSKLLEDFKNTGI